MVCFSVPPSVVWVRRCVQCSAWPTLASPPTSVWSISGLQPCSNARANVTSVCPLVQTTLKVRGQISVLVIFTVCYILKVSNAYMGSLAIHLNDDYYIELFSYALSYLHVVQLNDLALGNTVVSTFDSQLEGPWFESWLGPFMWSLHVLPRLAWVFFIQPLPQFKILHSELISDSELYAGVSVCLCDGLAACLGCTRSLGRW